MRYVAECGLYKESAVHTWAPGNVADPWLIASAKANGYTIVTEENSSTGLSKKHLIKVQKFRMWQSILG